MPVSLIVCFGCNPLFCSLLRIGFYKKLLLALITCLGVLLAIDKFGARLVVAHPEGHKDPQYLKKTIQRQSITLKTSYPVPSMLSAFLDKGT